MTALEERLRTELPELASGLMGETEAPLELLEEPTITADHEAVVPRRRLLVGTAAAALTGVGVVAAGRWFSPGRATNPLATSADPTGFGSWRAIADAPIVPREGGLAAWNGETAVFWAGRTGYGEAVSALRSGAFYDPVTDSWDRADTPSVTHPDVAAALAVGDEVFAVTKGSLLRVNLRDGSFVEPPEVSVVLFSIVEVNGRLWGVGSERWPVGQSGPDFVSFAEYLPDSNEWGPVMHLKAPAGSTVASLGNQFVSCDGDSNCVIVDPTRPNEPAIRFLSGPTSVDLPISAVVGNTIVALALASKDGRTAEVYRADGETWEPLDMVPTGDFGEVTLAAAGDWLVVVSPDQPPVAMDVASGEWHQFDDWPMTGVRNPSTVWTGTQLIVWGGLESEGSEGAIWTPPAS